MKILVLNGSPRKNGNTAALVEAFKEGAESAGNEVKVWNVGTMKIAGCLGCEYCHTKGAGQCVHNEIILVTSRSSFIQFRQCFRRGIISCFG